MVKSWKIHFLHKLNIGNMFIHRLGHRYVEAVRRNQRRRLNHRAGSKDGFSRLRTESWCWRANFEPRAPFYSKLLHGIRFRVVLWEESSSTQSPMRAVYSQVIFGYAMVRESSPKWVGEDVVCRGAWSGARLETRVQLNEEHSFLSNTALQTAVKESLGRSSLNLGNLKALSFTKLKYVDRSRIQ